MASYNIEIKKSAAKELQRIPGKDQERIITRIQKLSDDPRPDGCIKLSGEEKYRIRQGNYRILYQIHDDRLTIVVVRIADRKNAYRH